MHFYDLSLLYDSHMGMRIPGVMKENRWGSIFLNYKFIPGKRRREIGSAENKAKTYPSEASVGLF